MPLIRINNQQRNRKKTDKSKKVQQFLRFTSDSAVKYYLSLLDKTESNFAPFIYKQNSYMRITSELTETLKIFILNPSLDKEKMQYIPTNKQLRSVIYCVTLATANSTQKVTSDRAMPEAQMASIPWKMRSYIIFMKVVPLVLLSSNYVVTLFCKYNNRYYWHS